MAVNARNIYLFANHARSFLGAVKYRELHSENYHWQYLEAGDISKPTVLLVHGFGESKAVWRSLMLSLSRNYYVLAPDLPGLKSGIATQDGRYDFPRLAACLNEFVCALDLGRFHLLGHSLGANVAAVFAARYQQRMLSLVLMSLLAIDQHNPSSQIARFSDFQDLIRCERKNALQTLLQMLFYQPPAIPSAVLRYEERKMSSLRGFHQQVLADVRLNMLFLLQSLQYLPPQTMLIHGDDDVFQSDDNWSALRQSSRQLQFRSIPRCGHMPLLERPQELLQIYSNYLNSFHQYSLDTSNGGKDAVSVKS